MKKLLAILFAMTIFSAYARPTFVNPASPEGIFKQLFTELGKDIDHTYIQASTPIAASPYLTSDPTLTFWSAEWPSDTNIKSPKFTKDQLVGLLTTDTIMCSREFKSVSEMKGKTIKIASWGSPAVRRYLYNFATSAGATFVVVPYDGSGSTTRGYLGKDADTVFTTASRRSALEADTITKCFAFSEDGSLKFQYVDAILALNGLDTKQIRNLLKTKTVTPEWKAKFNGVRVLFDGDLIKIYSEAVSNFTP